MASLGGRSKFLHTSADTLFKGEPMVTLMEASDDASEDLQGTYQHTRVPFKENISVVRKLLYKSEGKTGQGFNSILKFERLFFRNQSLKG